jgi:MarR family transcriptional regulator, transcriptional regulator for hemolysin
MPADSPERTLGFLLHDVARLLRKRFEQKARGLGLSRSQWSVLAHLSRHEGINQSALAEILEIEPITLVRLVDKLEASGWVERRLHPKDRRVRLLFLTPKAHPTLEEMRALGAATREEAQAGLSQETRDELIETLLKIKANLSERTARAAIEPEPAERRRSHG